MTDETLDRETYDRHRKAGVSQTWEFGELLEAEEGSGAACRFLIKDRGPPLAVQARRESFGPMPAIYVGIGHELSLSGREVDRIIKSLAGLARVPTILQVDYIGQERSRAAGNYSTPQLLVDLAQEIKPDKKREAVSCATLIMLYAKV